MLLFYLFVRECKGILTGALCASLTLVPTLKVQFKKFGKIAAHDTREASVQNE